MQLAGSGVASMMLAGSGVAGRDASRLRSSSRHEVSRVLE